MTGKRNKPNKAGDSKPRRADFGVKRGPYAIASKHAKQRAFLEQYATCGRVHQSCRIVDVSPNTVRDWVNTDPDFAKAYDDADEAYGEYLESIGDKWVASEDPSPPVLIRMLEARNKRYKKDQAKQDATQEDGELPRAPEDVVKALAEQLKTMTANDPAVRAEVARILAPDHETTP